MKTAIFMAMSLNGYIARLNGDEDFLSHENWNSFTKTANKYQNFIIGRATYDAVNDWDEGYGFDDFVDCTKVVVSRNLDLNLKDGYTKKPNIQEAIQFVKDSARSEYCILTGGPSLNTSALEAKLIDEVWLNIQPNMISNGIAYISEEIQDVDLSLLSVEKLPEDILYLKYTVRK